ncbi:hypothetical protein PO909_001097, partial [Leuciscus waleckii]
IEGASLIQRGRLLQSFGPAVAKVQSPRFFKSGSGHDKKTVITGSQSTRWSVRAEEIGQILGGRFVKSFIHKYTQELQVQTTRSGIAGRSCQEFSSESSEKKEGKIFSQCDYFSRALIDVLCPYTVHHSTDCLYWLFLQLLEARRCAR